MLNLLNIFQPVKGVHIASGADDSYEPEVGHKTNDRKHRKKDALGVNNSYLGWLKKVKKKKRKIRWDKKTLRSIFTAS